MTIKQPVRVGRNEDSSAFLVADQIELDNGNLNGPARIEYTNGEVSPEMPLQQFYKFGAWYDVEDQDESDGR